MAEMTERQWRTAEEAAFAEECGITLGTLEHWACEASRRVESSKTDDEVRDEIEAGFARIRQLAEQGGDLKIALDALWKRLQLRGLVRENHRVEVVTRQVAEMPPERKVAALLADAVLGPLLESEVLRRRGLLLTEGDR